MSPEEYLSESIVAYQICNIIRLKSIHAKKQPIQRCLYVCKSITTFCLLLHLTRLLCFRAKLATGLQTLRKTSQRLQTVLSVYIYIYIYVYTHIYIYIYIYIHTDTYIPILYVQIFVQINKYQFTTCCIHVLPCVCFPLQKYTLLTIVSSFLG